MDVVILVENIKYVINWSRIYFDKEVQHEIETLKYTSLDFVSTLGGSLSLWLNLSFIGIFDLVVELFRYLVVRLRRCRKLNQDETETCTFWLQCSICFLTLWNVLQNLTSLNVLSFIDKSYLHFFLKIYFKKFTIDIRLFYKIHIRAFLEEIH